MIVVGRNSKLKFTLKQRFSYISYLKSKIERSNAGESVRTTEASVTREYMFRNNYRYKYIMYVCVLVFMYVCTYVYWCVCWCVFVCF